MALGCARAGRLSLVALADQATMAERLELEDHLASCARCHAEHAAPSSSGSICRSRRTSASAACSAWQRAQEAR